ncbi:NAD(P)/FAD-dependent oxidoreductase [Gordonia sp. CPCC 205515]|uniref:flavin-containing monooxygenase n=1 Tax=Gordonia sp. CPCC 205515 TaxID=3140791 RepID=UPI003AF3F35D
MNTTDSDVPTHVGVAIAGGGFGGVGAAIQLTRNGIDDYLLFERATELGGTWQANTYPGAQCDIPSALYSFSFAPNPEWTRLYPLQEEIKSYIERCADDYDVPAHTRLGTDVRSADWDELAQVWRIVTVDRTGTERSWTATFLLLATGPFSEPSVPDLPGLSEFGGRIFHSAEWDHDYDLAGKSVAVIGTGASAVQFVPQIQPKVQALRLFQRTPTWILPHPDQPIAPALQDAFRRIPWAQRAMRGSFALVQEMMVPGLVREPALLKPMAAAGRHHLRRQVTDPELRAKLTPTYEFGCKRPTFSNTYYPALTASNAEVITDSIERVTATGIVTADGAEHAVDAIIFGTGFKLTANEGFGRIRGTDGRSLAEVWAGEMRAYLGTMVTGFPNMFMMLGPNSVVYTSQVVTIEAQLDFVIDALKTMGRRWIRSIDVTPTAQQAFVDEVDKGLTSSVWNTGGCSSYYLSGSGRNFTFWPGFVFTMRHRMRRIRLSDFSIRMAGRGRTATSSEKVLVAR